MVTKGVQLIIGDSSGPYPALYFKRGFRHERNEGVGWGIEGWPKRVLKCGSS